MLPTSLLRTIVSAPKHSYHDAGVWLDLSYITPRIIVAAGPTDSFVSTIFRSPLDKVVSHLNKCYRTETECHWHIWNLRGEGAGYSSSTIGAENWSFYPIPDHLPPSIDLLLRIVLGIDQFLKKSPKNVALIHCKEGKGRSGTVCCAYLMFEAQQRGVLLTVDEAITAFTRRRMRKFFGPGISILSQVRYLEYWRRYLLFASDMRVNHKLYHLLEQTPFNKELAILSITIVRPTLLAILSKLNISTYVPQENGLEAESLVSETLMLPTITGTSSYYEIPLMIHLDRKLKDIRISFERQLCLAYAWFNLYFETLTDVNRPLPVSEHACISRKLVLDWEQFDGFRGIKFTKMSRLFDKVELQWVYHYGSE